MKCSKCGEEIEMKPGKSVNFCPNCAAPIPKLNFPTDNIIKTLVAQHGDGLFLETSILFSRVEDNLRNQFPDVLKRVRFAINEGVPQEIYALKSVDEHKRTLGLNVILSSLMADYNEEASYGIINLFADALGFNMLEKPQIIPPTSHEVSQSTSSIPSTLTTPVRQRSSCIISASTHNSGLKRLSERFGGYDWLVLEERGRQALIITEHIIEKKPFDPNTNRWGKGCLLYDWLNGDFYNELSRGNSGRIVPTDNMTYDNPWYPESKGSGKTRDNIFLLSLDEVCRYFGDSTSNLRKKGSTGSNYYINDGNNANRVATHNGTAPWWWLRSPGYGSFCAAYVISDGSLGVGGNILVFVSAVGGVRPALLLNL